MKKIMKLMPLMVALFAVLTAGSGCSAKVKSAYHERKAEKYFAAGDLERAEIEYLNVVHNDPENGKAAARLGGIYYDEGRLQRAAFFLNKASTIDTNDLDLRMKLAFINSSFGRFQEAHDTAEYVLARRPQDEQAPMLLAETARVKDFGDVRKQLQALAAKGDHATIEVALGNLALREHDLKNTAAAFDRAKALDAKSSWVNMALGSLSWLQNDLKAADEYFKTAANAPAAQSSFRLQYARFKLKTGQVAEAQKLLSEIITNAPNYVPAIMMQAEIAAQENKFDECEALLAKVLDRDEYNFDAMLFQGQVKRMHGDLAGALQSFNRLVRLYPQSPSAYYYLTGVNIAAGDQTAALANVGRALELQPDFTEALLVQSQLLLQGGNPGPVIVTLEKLHQRLPDNLDAQMLLADAYRMQNRVEDAMNIYTEAESRFTNNVKLPLLLGAAYLQKQNGEAARRQFLLALNMEPDNLTALGELLDAEILTKNFDPAMVRLQAEHERRPKELEIQFMIAKLFLAQGNIAKGEETLLAIAAMDPKNPSANLLLAQVYFDQKKNDQALVRLQDALVNSPTNISALMMVAVIRETEKDYAKAAANYEKVLTIDPTFSAAMNNLACIYLQNPSQLDRAYSLAQQARKLMPYDPSTADTLGWISFKRGDYASALSLLKESIAKRVGADQPEIQFHYGMACYMTGDEENAKKSLAIALQNSGKSVTDWQDECRQALSVLAINPESADAAARQMLEKCSASNASDPVVLSRLAQIYFRNGETDKAMASAQKMLALIPSHLSSLTILAQLYSAKDVPKAYEMAKAAYKIAPYNVEVQRLLGELAYASKDYKLSARVLKEAVKQPSVPAPLLFDLAKANFAVGNVTEAQTDLNQALALNPPTPLADDLNQMSALIAAANNSSAAMDSKKLSEILKNQPNNLPALVADAVNKERSGDKEAAVSSYENILGLYPDFVPAKRALAILYTGDSSKTDRAHDLAVEARDSYPDDLALTKTLGIISFQKSDFSRAIALLKQCVLRQQNDADTFYYLGAAQYQMKDMVASKSNLQNALTLKLAGKSAESAKAMLSEIK